MYSWEALKRFPQLGCRDADRLRYSEVVVPFALVAARLGFRFRVRLTLRCRSGRIGASVFARERIVRLLSIASAFPTRGAAMMPLRNSSSA